MHSLDLLSFSVLMSFWESFSLNLFIINFRLSLIMGHIYRRYGAYYDFIYKDKNYERECNDIVEYFNVYGKSVIHSILDVACGSGNHSIILSNMGYSVVGVDASSVMIRAASAKVSKGLDVDFKVQDMRCLSLDKTFDAAICLFGSFGYLLDDSDIVATLKRIYKHLNENGLFIFDFWPPYSFVILDYTKRRESFRWVEDESKRLLRLVNVTFDVNTNIVEYYMECFVFNSSGNLLMDHFQEKHLLRCFTPRELSSFLMEVGFIPLSFFDVNWHGEKIYAFDPLKATSSNGVCVAIKS